MSVRFFDTNKTLHTLAQIVPSSGTPSTQIPDVLTPKSLAAHLADPSAHFVLVSVKGEYIPSSQVVSAFE